MRIIGGEPNASFLLSSNIVATPLWGVGLELMNARTVRSPLATSPREFLR
jgi:hypothetical protein